MEHQLDYTYRAGWTRSSKHIGMQPAFGRQHRLPQKWPESMYLLDKKIYLKFHQIEKNLSGPNRRVPNPGFWQNKVRFN